MRQQIGNALRRARDIAVIVLLIGLLIIICLAVVGAAAQGAGIRPHLPALSHAGFGHACGDAVDSHGNLYVADGSTDGSPSTVTVYDPAGATITTFSAAAAVCSLAVDTSGNVYAAQSSNLPNFTGSVQKYNPSTPGSVTPATTFSLDTSVNGTGTVDPGPAKAVAVNPATSDVYVSHPAVNERQTATLTGFSAGNTFAFGSLPAACSNSSTANITFSTTAATLRSNVNSALETACSGNLTDDFLVSGTAAALVITFQGKLAGQDFPLLTCMNTTAGGTGICTVAPTTDGVPSHVAQYQSNGTLVTKTVGSGVLAANYSGVDVYGTNGRVFAFDGAHGQVAVFNPGAATPILTINGSNTPGGSIGAGVLGQGLAVDQATGHVYVFDRTHNLVAEFKSSGEFVTQLTTPLVAADPADIAVDSTSGPNAGVVYVADGATVEAFGPMTYPDEPTLSIIRSGPGSGTVTSSPVGIDCGLTCDAEFEPDTEVTLTATADPGSTFDTNSGWSGCDSVDVDGKCHITITDNAAVTVTFIKRTLLVSKAGSGTGSIVSDPAGIDCGSTCQGAFDDSSQVTLTPTADPRSKFTGWTKGSCDSVDQDGACTITMNVDRHATARFDSQPIISDEKASSVTESSAHLDASVNPEGTATIYFFEYISDAAWLDNGESFAGENPASKVPLAPISIGAGTTPLPVGVAIEGLAPVTTYHFRVVASNLAGTTLGERDEADEEIPQTFTTYAPQQVDTDCANQAFRGGESALLPDCRAYEQASPVDKNGGSIQGKAPLAKTSIGGDAISFESPAGIPGGTGAQEFPTYVGQRDSGGWSVMGLLPSENTGQSAKWLGWSPDFNEVFDEVVKFGEGTALIAKSTTNGDEQAIVPYTLPNPKFSYVGSSGDGSTVVFEASDASKTDLALTPNAAPGQPNVYAWDRGNPGAIQLAGVLPNGSAPAKGTTSAGPGEYTLEVHRLATDGSVFFTDRESGKLYLRLNPAAEETTNYDVDGNCEPDPDLACTIPISASQRTEGNGIGGRDAAGPRPSPFMAAVADGSSALFLSAEKLTNDATTGPEPGLPAISRANKADGGGKNLKFLPEISAHEVAIDEAEGYIYWTDPGHSRIGRAKLDGSVAPEPNYFPIPDVEEKPSVFAPARPLGIAVIDQGTAKYIFWTEQGEFDGKGDPKVAGGRIGRAGLDGSNVNHRCVKDITNPNGIAADANYIYWTMPHINNQALGEAGRAELSCAPGTVVTDLIKESVTSSGDIVVDASHIYVTSGPTASNASNIDQFEIDGSGNPFHGNFPIHLENVNSTPGLAIDGGHLYWSNPGTGEIGRSELDGSNREFDLITEASLPEGLGVDGDHIYWVSSQKQVSNLGTDLYRYDRVDGKLHDLVVDHGDPNGAEVQGVAGVSPDGSFVYFVANGVPDDVGNSPNEEGESAQPGDCKGGGDDATGACNLYVYHEGSIDFIAGMHAGTNFGVGKVGEEGSGDAENWVRGRAELGKVESDKTARVSDNGRILVFRSLLKLTKDYDNEGPVCGKEIDKRVPGPCTEFYRFTYDDKGLACISCDPRGEAPSGPARMASIRPVSLGAIPGTAVLSRNLSRDGNRFFFETPDALVAGDVNGEDGCPPWGGGAQTGSSLTCQDVYEWEASGTGSCEEGSPAFSSTSGGCVYLITSGRSDEASFFADADADGENVFVLTYDRLVGQDEDSLLDVYDARVGGGLAGQNQVKATPCAGEACKPPPSPPPPAQNAGSSGFSGPGSPSVKRPPHKKHKKRKHAKHRRHHGKKAGRAGR